MKPLLSDADRERIELAISELERHSALELVVAVVPRSRSYSGPRTRAAALLALAVGLVLFAILPHEHRVWALLLQVPAAVAAYAVLGTPPLARSLISRAEADRAVRARGYQMFTECGVHHTRQETGVLLMLSELERRALLLGDRAVHDVVGDAGWQAHTARLVESIRGGRAADGVVRLIGDLTANLAPQFPRAEHDVNELPNQVLHHD